MKWSVKSKVYNTQGFPGGTNGKEPACQCRRYRRQAFDPWVRKIPWRREWQPSSVLLPGESHGHRSLVLVHRATKTQTQLRRLNTQPCTQPHLWIWLTQFNRPAGISSWMSKRHLSATDLNLLLQPHVLAHSDSPVKKPAAAPWFLLIPHIQSDVPIDLAQFTSSWETILGTNLTSGN